MKIYTKESLIQAIKDIRDQGWIENNRPFNDGAVGNMLEDLLGIDENNLPLPNASEWELKAQKENSKSLITLFHMEPSPTAIKFIPQIFLPQFGWPHKEAGKKYPLSEKSFRQTICSQSYSDRGFSVIVDQLERKVMISFDVSKISKKHDLWKQSILCHTINPQPYWGFDDLFYKVATKLHNCFFVKAQSKKVLGKEYFHYQKIFMLKKLSQDHFINAIQNGLIYIDFDARSGHNHGTKFRIRRDHLIDLYSECTEF